MLNYDIVIDNSTQQQTSSVIVCHLSCHCFSTLL